MPVRPANEGVKQAFCQRHALRGEVRDRKANVRVVSTQLGSTATGLDELSKGNRRREGG